MLFGSFEDKFVYGLVASAGVVLAAVYMIRLFQRVMHDRVGPVVRSRDLGRRRAPEQLQTHLDLRPQQLEHLARALLPTSREPPEHRPAGHGGAGAECQRLQNVSTAADSAVDEDLDRLTEREREVMRLIARGYAYKEVAKELFISVKTVETHMSSVLRKLQLSSRHELTKWASDRRLL